MKLQNQKFLTQNPLDFKSSLIDFKLQFMLEDLFYHYRFLASEKNIDCFLVFPDHLNRTFRADPIKIEYIISTLLSHCIEFTEKGRIDLSVKQKNLFGSLTELMFTIEDTGTGNIFEDSKSKKIYESELGLAKLDSSSLNKVFKMAEYLGGNITISSNNYQNGVRFTLTLPLEAVN